MAGEETKSGNTSALSSAVKGPLGSMPSSPDDSPVLVMDNGVLCEHLGLSGEGW